MVIGGEPRTLPVVLVLQQDLMQRVQWLPTEARAAALLRLQPQLTLRPSHAWKLAPAKLHATRMCDAIASCRAGMRNSAQLSVRRRVL